MNLKRLFHKLKYRPWKRDIKFFKQRLTRGFDDSETFSLDHSLAKLIAPRLKRFKEVSVGTPLNQDEKEWSDQLDKMIAAFEWAGSEERWSNPFEAQKHQEGINLFAENFFGLWW